MTDSVPLGPFPHLDAAHATAAPYYPHKVVVGENQWSELTDLTDIRKWVRQEVKSGNGMYFVCDLIYVHRDRIWYSCDDVFYFRFEHQAFHFKMRWG